MTKAEIIEQLKGLADDAEYNRTCIMQENPLFYLEDSFEMWDNDVKALRIAIKAVEAFDYDEREEITVTLKAKKSPEGDDTYYCDLETGERLIIRGGELEGVYEPAENEIIKAFEEVFDNISCRECPCRSECGKDIFGYNRHCYEIALAWYRNEVAKDENKS